MFAKKKEKNAFQKVDALFLRKKSVPINIECVPKGNNLERVPSVQERFFFLKKGTHFFGTRPYAFLYKMMNNGFHFSRKVFLQGNH